MLTMQICARSYLVTQNQMTEMIFRLTQSDEFFVCFRIMFPQLRTIQIYPTRFFATFWNFTDTFPTGDTGQWCISAPRFENTPFLRILDEKSTPGGGWGGWGGGVGGVGGGGWGGGGVGGLPPECRGTCAVFMESFQGNLLLYPHRMTEKSVRHLN